MLRAIFQLTLGVVLSTGLWAQQRSVLFAALDNGVHRSMDGGRTWERTSAGLDNARIVNITAGMRNDGRIVYAGGDTGLFKTTNGGQRWTRVLNEANVSSVSVDPSDEQRVYAVASGKLFSSNDGGASWTPASTPWPVATVVMDPFSTFRFYISAQLRSQGGIAMTRDRGATWEVLSQNLASPLLSVDPNLTGRLATALGQLIQTRDFGQTWFSSGPSPHDLFAFVPEEFHLADPWVMTALATDPYRPGDSHVCFTAVAYQFEDPLNPFSDYRTRLVHGWGSHVANVWTTGTFPNQQPCQAVLREPQVENVLLGAGTKLYRRETLISAKITEVADLGSTIRALAAVQGW
jgi:hypothetical protein